MNESLMLGGFEDYNDEQLEMVLANALAAKMKKCEKKITQMFDKMVKLEEKQEIIKDDLMLEMEKRDATYQKQMDVAVNSVRLIGRNSTGEYIKQTELGKQYVVNISSISMGTLLRLCGLAHKDKSTTIPMMQDGEKYYILEPVKVNDGVTIQSCSWHKQKCMEAIDKWLKKNKYYEEFYSINNQEQMKEYIKKTSNQAWREAQRKIITKKGR